MTVESEIGLVIARRHRDPHHVLGAHSFDDGVVVRAFRPGACQVRARPQGGEFVMLEQRDPAGLFEALAAWCRMPLRYELEVSYPDGSVYTLRDAYAFAPTLGNLDLHLAGEGRHEAARRAAGGARARDRRCAGHLVRCMGAEQRGQ